MRLALGFLLAAVVVAGLGCPTPAPSDDARLTVTIGAGSTSASAGGGSATGAGGSGGTGAGGGPAPAVKLGVTPNPIHTGEGPPTPSEALLADLTSYAAGVRAAAITAHWADLTSADGINALAARVAELRGHGLEVMLTIDVVDRHVARRPASVAGLSWDHAQSIASLVAVIDALVAKLGGDLALLVVGRDVDVYLQSHSGEATALVNFAAKSVAHVPADGPTRAAVGVSFRSTPPEGPYGTLIGIGTAVALSYAPDLGQATVTNGSTPGKDLDAALPLAAKRPVYLIEVSFTSAAGLGATAAGQAQHVADLFAALAARRAHFPVVNLARLNDLTAVACAEYAGGQGLPDNHPEVSYVCASGLRDPSGAAKKSWYDFLAAAATYAQP